MLWLEKELHGANKSEPVVLFMHTYPDDLKKPSEKQKLIELIERHNVALVEMGHTHYNELANDGTTIFAATRSTGQIEEGPVGYSLSSVDGGIVSWRFKPLDEGFPFVLITAPADHRLQRDGHTPAKDSMIVRAVVFGDRPVQEVDCRIDDGGPVAMQKDGEGCWVANVPLAADRATVTVRAVDETGRPGRHSIQTMLAPSTPSLKTKTGSDLSSVGAWVENGIPGTRLGPNRNAKPF